MGVDLPTLVRRHKPQRRLRQLQYRDRADLPAFNDFDARAYRGILLDTNIYIFAAAGTLDAQSKVGLESILQHHSTVCLGEIAVGLANRDVASPTWRSERNYWEELFAKLPKARTYAPDAEIWSAAGILAGTLARLQGFQPYQRNVPIRLAQVDQPEVEANVRSHTYRPETMARLDSSGASH